MINKKNPRLSFPESKSFCFTILDDTDDATTENIFPIYKFLTKHNMYITKTVWPVDCPEGSAKYSKGQTLDDDDYMKAINEIKYDGHEIAFHCATKESSLRERTIEAFEKMKSEFGYYPRLHCNHGQNKENIYWGYKRFSLKIYRALYKLIKKNHYIYDGENHLSPFYWGDVHKKHIKYTRNFTFLNELNTIKIDPRMPYLNEFMDQANYIFSTADAPDVFAFKKYVTKEKIDKLINEGGICILSTHLGKGYCNEGKIDDYFYATIKYISSKNGYFMPVSNVLDHLLNHNKIYDKPISRYYIYKIETSFLLDMLQHYSHLE